LYLADGNFRKRDERFIDRDRFKPKSRRSKWFKADEFDYHPKSNECYCPAGNKMWRSHTTIIDGNEYVTFVGYLKDCRVCPLQAQCMRKPIKEQGRAAAFRIEQ
jgi:hypothetical protein